MPEGNGSSRLARIQITLEQLAENVKRVETEQERQRQRLNELWERTDSRTTN